MAANAPRHYTGADTRQVVEWKCPGCGESNISVLGSPCSVCGAGGGAKHVGIDPIVRKGQTPAEAPLGAVKPPAVSATPFDRWLFESGISTDTAGYVLARKAWNAAIAYVQRQMTNAERRELPLDEAIETAAPSVALPGTRESRTIVAALRFFLDQIVRASDTAAEEYEWLQPEEIDALIQKLETPP